jgi:hypothetical protein
MDSLGTSPGKIAGLLLTRPNNIKVKLTHQALQCLQSLHGLRPLGKILKELCVKTMLSTDLTDPQWSSFPGTYFVCRTSAYACLHPNWRGICTLALLTPNNQSFPIPLAAYTQSKRAIQTSPLLVAMGITTGMGAGIKCIASSVHTIKNYQKNFLMT